ncbi:MAG: VIT1/CCC1 transporter family protein [Patescibacteria group bacterium]|jgi:VIT1/CCC1 family predicted Fe2+/Mn2+ transporter
MPRRERRRRHQHIKLHRSLRRRLRIAQQNEITEHLVYLKLSEQIKDKKNSEVLRKIASEEKKHAEVWKKYTEEDVQPNRFRAYFYTLVSRIFGLTFGVKLLEQNEESAQQQYKRVEDKIPEAEKIRKEEEEHEKNLLGMIDEENLKYVGSMVLGVNDALVELTGALAGLTLAFQRGNLIAVTGLITGIAASFSMGASEYLSTKSEDESKDPVKASLYTGGMYIFTVLFLVLPYFIFSNVYVALGSMLSVAILIIFLFTFYISVAQDLPFRRRFLEMAGISLGVSAFSFLIGFLVRNVFGIEI